MSTTKRKPFSFARFFRSFRYAGQGFVILLQHEQNMLLHLIATVITLAAALYFPLNYIEWCIIILAITVVWTVEMINTAMEALVDLVSRDRHPLAGAAKDLAAGAVLFAALAAGLVGIIIFGKHILLMFPFNS